MAFERGEVLEVLRPILVDGELMQAGDLIEVPASDARQLRARKVAATPAPKSAKQKAA